MDSDAGTCGLRRLGTVTSITPARGRTPQLGGYAITQRRPSPHASTAGDQLTHVRELWRPTT